MGGRDPGVPRARADSGRVPLNRFWIVTKVSSACFIHLFVLFMRLTFVCLFAWIIIVILLAHVYRTAYKAKLSASFSKAVLPSLV